MVNIRSFRILFPSAENQLPDGDFAGYVGEHNATLLEITPPKEMTDCSDIATYRIAFELTNCRAVHSDPITKAASISMLLPSQITSSKVIAVQLEGYSADNDLVAKSEKMVKIKFHPSVCGVETGANNEPFGIVSEVTANTKARHTHANATVLDGLSDSGGTLQYNGKPISGVTVDTALSEKSTNPVQNKVVKAKFDAVDKKAAEIKEKADAASAKADANETAINKLKDSVPDNTELLKKFTDSGVLLYNGIPIGEKPTSSVELSVNDDDLFIIKTDANNNCVFGQYQGGDNEIPVGTKLETIEFFVDGKWIDIHGMAELDKKAYALNLYKVFADEELESNVCAVWSPKNQIVTLLESYAIDRIRFTYALPKISFYVDGNLYHVEYSELKGMVQLPEEPEKDGYTLEGWTVEGSTDIVEFPYTVGGEDVNFVAKFRATPYTATFYADGVEVDSVNYVAGESITADIPTKTGYEFAGWKPEIPETMPAENTSFEALWQAKTFDAVFMVDGEVYKTVPTVFGEQISAPLAPSKTGYTFNGWTPTVGIMNTEGKTFEATWNIKQTNVYFMDSGSVIQKVTANYNSQVSAIDNPTKQYYTLSGWKDSNGNSVDFPITVGENDIYLSAEWVQNEITLMFRNKLTPAYDFDCIHEAVYKCGEPLVPPKFEVEDGHVMFGWINANEAVSLDPTSPIAFPDLLYEDCRITSIVPDVTEWGDLIEYAPLYFEGGYIEAEEGYNDTANIWGYARYGTSTHLRVFIGGTGSLNRNLVDNTPWLKFVLEGSYAITEEIFIGHGITELADAYAVRKIYLPSTLTKICGGAFTSASPAIYYEGTEEQWSKIIIEADNPKITTPVQFNCPKIILNNGG